MLQDPIIQVYFVLVAPIVQEFERVSVCFQAENCDAEKVFESLHQLHQTLLHREYSQGEKLASSMCDFGAKLEAETLFLVTIDPRC